MKVKEFVRFHSTPELALKNLSDEIYTFLKKDKDIVIISLSHAITYYPDAETGEAFVASALLSYK